MGYDSCVALLKLRGHFEGTRCVSVTCVLIYYVHVCARGAASDVRRPVVPGGGRHLLQDQAGPAAGRDRLWDR